MSEENQEDATNYAEEQQAINEHVEGLEKKLKEQEEEIAVLSLELKEATKHNKELNDALTKIEDELNTPVDPTDELALANAKIEKLIAIMMLTDDSVKHINGGVMPRIQMAEYKKAFEE